MAFPETIFSSVPLSEILKCCLVWNGKQLNVPVQFRQQKWGIQPVQRTGEREKEWPRSSKPAKILYLRIPASCRAFSQPFFPGWDRIEIMLIICMVIRYFYSPCTCMRRIEGPIHFLGYFWFLGNVIMFQSCFSEKQAPHRLRVKASSTYWLLNLVFSLMTRIEPDGATVEWCQYGAEFITIFTPEREKDRGRYLRDGRLDRPVFWCKA